MYGRFILCSEEENLVSVGIPVSTAAYAGEILDAKVYGGAEPVPGLIGVGKDGENLFEVRRAVLAIRWRCGWQR